MGIACENEDLSGLRLLIKVHAHLSLQGWLRGSRGSGPCPRVGGACWLRGVTHAVAVGPGSTCVLAAGRRASGQDQRDMPGSSVGCGKAGTPGRRSDAALLQCPCDGADAAGARKCASAGSHAGAQGAGGGEACPATSAGAWMLGAGAPHEAGRVLSRVPAGLQAMLAMRPPWVNMPDHVGTTAILAAPEGELRELIAGKGGDPFTGGKPWHAAKGYDGEKRSGPGPAHAALFGCPPPLVACTPLPPHTPSLAALRAAQEPQTFTRPAPGPCHGRWLGRWNTSSFPARAGWKSHRGSPGAALQSSTPS